MKNRNNPYRLGAVMQLQEALMMILIELKKQHNLTEPCNPYSFEIKWLEDYVNKLYDNEITIK